MGNAPCGNCRNGVLQSVSNDDFDDENVVLLNVYDLNEDWLQANDIFQETLELGGAFHAGVEIGGREWSFGNEGVCCTYPRCHDVHVFRTSIFIGYTKYDRDEVTCILEDEMSLRWPGVSYDMLSKNCCSFARSVCKRLCGNTIPDWVDRLPRLASIMAKPASAMVDMAADLALVSIKPGRDMSMDSDDFSIDLSMSIASSVFSTPACTPTPTPKAKHDHTGLGNRQPSFGLPLRYIMSI